MPIDQVESPRIERRGSTSNSYVPRTHAFAPSGTSAAVRILPARSRSEGATPLSSALSRKAFAAQLGFPTAVSSRKDPELAHAIFLQDLGIPWEQAVADLWRLLHDSSHSFDVICAFRSLLAEVEAEPIEDGVSHPAEQCLSTFIAMHGFDEVLRRMFAPDVGVSRTAAVVRLLGRMDQGDAASRRQLLQQGLASKSLEVRDAAVTAAGTWNDAGLAPLLRAHIESTPWLADYAARVACDLEG